MEKSSLQGRYDPDAPSIILPTISPSLLLEHLDAREDPSCDTNKRTAGVKASESCSTVSPRPTSSWVPSLSTPASLCRDYGSVRSEGG